MNTISTYIAARKGRLLVLLLIAAAAGGAYVLDLGPTKSSQEASVITSTETDDADGLTEGDVVADGAGVTDSTAGDGATDGSDDGLAYVDTTDQGIVADGGSATDTGAPGTDSEVVKKPTDSTSNSGGTVLVPGGSTPADKPAVSEDDEDETTIVEGRKTSTSRTPRVPRDPRMFPGGSSSGGTSGGSTGGSTGGTTLPTADVTGPIASFVDALDATTVVGTLSVRAAITDPVVLNAVTSGVAEVAFLIDGTLFATTSTVSAPGVYTLTLDSASLTNGAHSIGVQGTDVAGNVGSTITATVTVANPTSDVTAPVIELLGALQGTTASGTLALSASTSDVVVDGAVTSGVAEVAFLVDNVLIATTSTPTAPGLYETILDTLTLTNGEHGLAVRALDVAGNLSLFAYATVTIANVIVPPVTPSPFTLGGVSLTFDDANASQYQYVFPLLKVYNQAATLYVPTGLIDSEGYMTWGNLGELKNGGWEIGGHSVNHAELPLLTDTEEEQEVAGSLTDLVEQGFMATSFATPYGAYDTQTIATIAQSYDSHRNFAHISQNKWPYNKYFLQIQRVTDVTTVAEVSAWVDEAIANDTWLIIVLHEVQPQGIVGDEWSWTTEQLAETLNYLQSKGIKTKTVADMLKHGDNLVANSTFESGLSVQGEGWWTDNTSRVTLDTDTNGAYPEAVSSIKFEGDPLAPAHLFSPLMNIDPAQLYGIRFYVNTKDFVSGELGFYIDEYDVDGNWISGKWLGQAGNSWVIDESYAYTATSAAVKKVSLQVYETAGSIGTAYIDSVEFFKPQ